MLEDAGLLTLSKMADKPVTRVGVLSNGHRVATRGWLARVFPVRKVRHEWYHATIFVLGLFTLYLLLAAIFEAETATASLRLQPQRRTRFPG